MFIVTYRKIFYAISALLITLSVGALVMWGLVLGIDFEGGASLEVDYAVRPTQESVEAALSPLSLGVSVRYIGDNGVIVRSKALSDTERGNVVSALNTLGTTTVKQFSSIGPVLGKEAAQKSLVSIVLVLLCIVLFVTFAFRHVSEPVSSWKYGLITILALLHDVLIPAGVFAFLGHFYGIEIDTLFVTALLVVLGFSVHDTIVVFDRVRENLKHNKDHGEKKDFDRVVGDSISQTFARSINTSLTTLLALVVLYIFGGEATRLFSLALIIGIVAGTYSSIFLGSPLLVTLEKLKKNK